MLNLLSQGILKLISVGGQTLLRYQTLSSRNSQVHPKPTKLYLQEKIFSNQEYINTK